MTTMIRHATLLLLGLAPAMQSQSGSRISQQVAQVTNGEVRMTYATRSSVCGDGRDAVSIGDRFTTSGSMESYGRWSGFHCVRGPARVTLTMRDHEIVDLRTSIGGSWPAGEAKVADLGHVPASDAASYFLALTRTLGSSKRMNPLLAAAVADSANVSPEMLRIAQTTSLPRETRRRAVHWAGTL